jgi:hypothetical protein
MSKKMSEISFTAGESMFSFETSVTDDLEKAES